MADLEFKTLAEERAEREATMRQMRDMADR